MITLYQPPGSWGIPNVSPFCAKLETYLRMAGLPYEVAKPDFRGAPKGKIPYIRDGELVLGDSGHIIDYLVSKHGDPLDGALDAGQLARAHAATRMLEEHTYFALANLRWSSPDAWPHLQAAFKPLLPPGIGPMILRVVRKKILATSKAQGVGRHSKAEILAAAAADLDALVALMGGGGPFFFGASPRRVDATLYGFLIQLAAMPWPSAEQALFKARPALVAQVDAMTQRYWAAKS